MPRCLAAASIAAIALIAAAPDVRAASFDCSRAATRVETTICEDRALGALDKQMAQNYRALLNRTSGATESRIRSEQKSWLRQRNACGGDARCLNREYRARIQDIASASGADAPRQTAAVETREEERPRGLLDGILNRDARAPEPAKPERAEDKPGLFARMIDRVTPDFVRKDEEPEKPATANQQAQQEQPASQQPLKIVGQRPTVKTRQRESEPVIATVEPAPRDQSELRLESRPQSPPEPARRKSVARTEPPPEIASARTVDPQPQAATTEPVRKKFVLRPVTEPQVAPEQAPQVAVRQERNSQRKWQDLDIGGGFAAPEPTLRTTRTEPAGRTETPRVQTTRVKPEPVEETADRPLTSALTYAPENEDEPAAHRILRQEPRVQMIKPLIVRDRPPATEPSESAVIGDTPAPPLDNEATAAIPPEVENLVPADFSELANIPGETPALPQDTETLPPVSSPVAEALKNRFDTAYGTANRIDLLAPLRETGRFNASRFDIFDPPGG